MIHPLVRNSDVSNEVLQIVAVNIEAKSGPSVPSVSGVLPFEKICIGKIVRQVFNRGQHYVSVVG
jgi:hypothetical protein